RMYGGEMDLTYFSDFRQGTDWLASGKYSLCLLCRLRRAQEQGLPVAEANPYQFKEAPGIGSNNGAIVLMNNQPHPSAARVFINWYLSREGQIAFRQANNTLEDETTTSMREDLPLSVVPEAARRRKDVDYIEISRHDWIDWKPVGDLIARRGSGRASENILDCRFWIVRVARPIRTVRLPVRQSKIQNLKSKIQDGGRHNDHEWKTDHRSHRPRRGAEQRSRARASVLLDFHGRRAGSSDQLEPARAQSR